MFSLNDPINNPGHQSRGDLENDPNVVELSSFSLQAGEHAFKDSLDGLDPDDAREFIKVGIEKQSLLRSGSFIQKDASIVHCNRSSEGVEISGIAQALEKDPSLEQYMWTLLDPEKDDLSKFAKDSPLQGFCIQTKPGVKIEKPLQTCLHIAKDGYAQRVHNLIIVEEDSEVHIIAGCSTAGHVESGLHLGLSEFFVKKGATLKYTMIHEWGRKIVVRPKTAVHVEEGGVFISNYISLKPVGSLVSNPVTYLEKNATARFNSILVAGEGTYMDVGSVVELRGPGARAEIISRAIAAGGTIISRGHLKSMVPGVKGHLECKGLILKNGLLHAIPELSGFTPGVELSHEAAVGKIDRREIEYLMARGLDEEEAISTIVRGFLNVDIDGLPAELVARMDRAVQETEQDMM
ncbi:MAG: SufD family Fe-S cluster assembly protein [Desulfobacterium sp.]|nr:SufD family Fe-S cluster assembly protein [Desulfobacterium sp.]